MRFSKVVRFLSRSRSTEDRGNDEKRAWKESMGESGVNWRVSRLFERLVPGELITHDKKDRNEETKRQHATGSSTKRFVQRKREEWIGQLSEVVFEIRRDSRHIVEPVKKTGDTKQSIGKHSLVLLR